VHLLSQSFIISAVRSILPDSSRTPNAIGTEGFDEIIAWLYTSPEGPQLLKQAVDAGKEMVERSERPDVSESQREEGKTISRGAAVPLKRLLQRMTELQR